jgi:hypothetical protein
MHGDEKPKNETNTATDFTDSHGGKSGMKPFLFYLKFFNP